MKRSRNQELLINILIKVCKILFLKVILLFKEFKDIMNYFLIQLQELKAVLKI
jgi:hypothetical protein